MRNNCLSLFRNVIIASCILVLCSCENSTKEMTGSLKIECTDTKFYFKKIELSSVYSIGGKNLIVKLDEEHDTKFWTYNFECRYEPINIEFSRIAFGWQNITENLGELKVIIEDYQYESETKVFSIRNEFLSGFVMERPNGFVHVILYNSLGQGLSIEFQNVYDINLVKELINNFEFSSLA